METFESYLLVFPDPQRPEEKEKHLIRKGETIQAVLNRVFNEGKKLEHFETPHVVCNQHGVYFLKEHEEDNWEHVVNDKEVICVSPATEGFVLGALLIIAVVAFVAFTFLLELPKPPDSIDEPDSLYDLRGRRNQSKLGQAIEVGYGNPRNYFSYAANPYTRYIGNDAHGYYLYVVTQGECDMNLSDLLIDDTPLNSYPEVEAEIYQPFQSVTLFEDNVETSDELADFELYGPGDANYPAGGWSQYFILNSAGTVTNKLEIDYGFPSGLYYSGSDLENTSVTFQIQILEVGGITPLQTISVSHTLATNTPQRFTRTIPVPSGRYQVRFRRITNEDDDGRRQDTVRVIGAKAFLPSVANYGDVTLLAVRIRATNSINSQNSNIVSGFLRRRIRTWNVNSQSWDAVNYTRSPIWAFLDALQNVTYGHMLYDEFFDLDWFHEQAVRLENEGRYFDWIFDRKTSLFEVLRAICSSMRGVPIVEGSRITIHFLEPESIPVAIFNDDNMVRDSFAYIIDTAKIGENDGVEVEYIDHETWKKQTMVCLVGNDRGLNLEKVSLTGQTDRTLAFRDGLLQRAKRKYEREHIEFITDTEGLLLKFGDPIAVSSEIPLWGTGGEIQSIDGLNVLLDRPIDLTDMESPIFLARRRDGSASGPFALDKGLNNTKTRVLQVPAPLDNVETFEGEEKPLYLIGDSANSEHFYQLCIVENLQPDEEDRVKVEARVYMSRIWENELAIAPEEGEFTGFAPQVITNLEINTFEVDELISTQDVNIFWDLVFGATQYELDYSLDNENWTSIDTLQINSHIFTIPQVDRNYFFRVRASNSNTVGSYAYWQGRLFAEEHNRVTSQGDTRVTNIGDNRITR